jgi:hypothetical protein
MMALLVFPHHPPAEIPPPPVAQPIAVPPPAPNPPPEKPAPVVEAPKIEPPIETPPASAPPTVRVAVPAPRTKNRFVPKVKPVPAAPAPAIATTVAPPPKPVAPTSALSESGFLSLDTTPWSTVSESGRVIGQTPLIRVKMSEGSHTLTLTTERGTARTFYVNIKAGQTVSKRLGLE